MDWRTVVLWVAVAGLWASTAWLIDRVLEESDNDVTAVYGIRGDSFGEDNGN